MKINWEKDIYGLRITFVWAIGLDSPVSLGFWQIIWETSMILWEYRNCHGNSAGCRNWDVFMQKLTTNGQKDLSPNYDVPSKLSNQKPNFHLSKLSISKKPSISRRKLSFLNFHNFSAFWSPRAAYLKWLDFAFSTLNTCHVCNEIAISGRLRSGPISDVKTNKETTHLYSQLRKYLSPTDQRCSLKNAPCSRSPKSPKSCAMPTVQFPGVSEYTGMGQVIRYPLKLWMVKKTKLDIHICGPLNGLPFWPTSIQP